MPVSPKVQKAVEKMNGHPSFEARGFDAGDLMSANLADPQYVCRPWVAEGVTLVVGRPKVGKTTLLRQLVHAANTGGEFLSARCQRSEVLFLTLEEGERLMRRKLLDMRLEPAALRGVRLEFAWPLGLDGVARLRVWLKEGRQRAELPALIVIDSLTRYRVPPSDRGNAFMMDYEALKGLADLAKEFPGLCIVVLHHTTKATPDDPVAAISGTYGLVAAADNYLIVLKQADGFRLHAGGRLWLGDATDYELRREDGRWVLAGEWVAAEGRVLGQKQQIAINMLKAGALSTSEIAKRTDQASQNVTHMMQTLADRGFVARLANGWELIR